MSTVARYRIIGVVTPTRIIERERIGAPSQTWMCSWGTERMVRFVVRYYPSRKGWRVIDIRNARCARVGSNKVWVGVTSPGKVYPTEASAVMFAIHMCAEPLRLL